MRAARGRRLRLHHGDGSLMLVYLQVAGDRFNEVVPDGNAIELMRLHEDSPKRRVARGEPVA